MKKKLKNNYFSKNRAKYLIKYHIIFSVKYRKHSLNYVGCDIIEIMKQISMDYDFDINEIEVDKDHMHILINSTPQLSPSMIVRILKQKSTHEIYKKFKKLLNKNFWKEKTFWSDGYFVCTTGDASTETIKQYIKNQG